MPSSSEFEFKFDISQQRPEQGNDTRVNERFSAVPLSKRLNFSATSSGHQIHFEENEIILFADRADIIGRSLML